MRTSTLALALMLISADVYAEPFVIVFNPNRIDAPDTVGGFDAPAAGGYIGSFVATIFGVTFDIPDPATDNTAPTYDSVMNAIGAPSANGDPFLLPNVPALIAHAGAFDGIV